MLTPKVVLLAAFGYMGVLFAIAFFGDKRAEAGKSIISTPYIYALSLAVYCTAWTFYGSVGAAGRSGVTGFLAIYIGPTLTMTLGWPVLRKIIRISKANRITSIADFIGSRYGKSAAVAGAVTVIAVLGIVPYMSVQIKAISASYQLISRFPEFMADPAGTRLPAFRDTSFFVAILLAVFAVIFGTRHLEATERHEGLVAAIAFESVVKPLAILSAGLFVVLGLYDGVYDLFRQAPLPGLSASPPLVMTVDAQAFTGWTSSLFLAMMAVFLLPRQFQVMVVENVDETHLKKAVWLFPLYLFLINLFVLPIALSGMYFFLDLCRSDELCRQGLASPFSGVLSFSRGNVDADYFALALLMAQKHQGLALFTFIGGMSAATGMVIVETIALSTMVSNDLLMPLLLRFSALKTPRNKDFGRLLLGIRRISILAIMLLGYLYYHYVVEYYSLVSIGMISFAAVAQFSPALLGGIFWKGATRAGALSGLCAGFLVWIYTLVLPSLAQAGFLPDSLLARGPFGISFLNPHHLLGLPAGTLGFNPYTHAVFWSMAANIGLFTGVSLFSKQGETERKQATLFVDVFRHSVRSEKSSFWRATASMADLRTLLERFLGKDRTREALARYALEHRLNLDRDMVADAGLVSFVEKLLAGAVGSASALGIVRSVVEEEPLSRDDIMQILDETQQIIIYSRELEKASRDLAEANERLKELDRLKDQFIATVSHELRTPLTSVRALAEILHTTPDLARDRHRQFTGIIIKESERLSRLINDVLNFQKIESGRIEWQMQPLDFAEVIDEALATMDQLIREKQIRLIRNLPRKGLRVSCDRDRLIQVMVNLISNAVKFCDPENGEIRISEAPVNPGEVGIRVWDNGQGIAPKDQDVIFEAFRQVTKGGRPSGTGIGLTISRRIIRAHGGRIWVESEPAKGTAFLFTLPLIESSP